MRLNFLSFVHGQNIFKLGDAIIVSIEQGNNYSDEATKSITKSDEATNSITKSDEAMILKSFSRDDARITAIVSRSRTTLQTSNADYVSGEVLGFSFSILSAVFVLIPVAFTFISINENVHRKDVKKLYIISC